MEDRVALRVSVAHLLPQDDVRLEAAQDLVAGPSKGRVSLAVAL